MTSKGCLFALAMRLTPSGPSGSYLIHSRRCSAAYRTSPSCDPNFAVSFRWLKEKGVTSVITAERVKAHSPGTDWKNMSPTACCS